MTPCQSSTGEESDQNIPSSLSIDVSVSLTSLRDVIETEYGRCNVENAIQIHICILKFMDFLDSTHSAGKKGSK